MVVGYVTRGERRGVGGGESEITPFRDGSGFPGVEANGGCFFVDFGNRGQAGGGHFGVQHTAVLARAAHRGGRGSMVQGRGIEGSGGWPHPGSYLEGHFVVSTGGRL